MYNQIETSFYVLCAFSLLLIPAAYTVYKTKSRKNIALFSLFLSAIATVFIFYFYGKSILTKRVESYLNVPIHLESYYGENSCEIILYDNFSYKIKCKKETVKRGDWDVHFERSSPDGDVMITVDDHILGMGELKVKTN